MPATYLKFFVLPGGFDFDFCATGLDTKDFLQESTKLFFKIHISIKMSIHTFFFIQLKDNFRNKSTDNNCNKI